MAGQTINDRLLAARHSLAGQGLAKSVCKATTEEMIGPKKKHLDYLVHCTNEPNVSIPHLANLLIERSQNTNWVVVYKALITVHHLLAYGNERFIQYLASSNSTFNLSNFLDKGGVQGYDMSPFIRRYAKYLNEKALSYRTVAFDFCKVKRGKEEGSLRTMNADKLLKTLPVLQAQLDSLLEFDCQANDLTNGVINMCFMLLFRDLIRLFACYNDGIINLLEKYFDMNKKQCRDALDLYKKFLVRMDRVGEFLKVAENVGIDKGDIPDLTKAPSSLLDTLEGHLALQEGRKGSAANTPTQAASNQKNVKSGVSALSSTSSSFGTAAASTRFDSHSNGIDESIKAQALAEEEAAMNQYKQSKLTSTPGSAAATNPFLSSPPGNQSAPIVDLFGSPTTESRNIMQEAGGVASGATAKPSDYLVELGNPFADMFGAPASGGGMPPNSGGAGVVVQPAPNNMSWMSNGTGFNNGGVPAAGGPQVGGNSFVSDSNFSSVFGSTEPAGFDALGDVLKPGAVMSAINPQLQTGNVNIATGGVMQQQHQQQQQQGGQSATASGKVLTGDLDSSLASLAENLTINKSASAQVKGVQWNTQKNVAKPGGAGWTPQPMAATTGAGYRPMAQGMTISPAPSTFHHPYVHAPYPAMSPYMQQGMPMRPPMMGPGQPMMAPTSGMSMSGMGGQAGGMQAMMPTSQPQGMMAGQPQTVQQQQTPQQQQSGVVTTNNASNVQLDPFGAL